MIPQKIGIRFMISANCVDCLNEWQLIRLKRLFFSVLLAQFLKSLCNLSLLRLNIYRVCLGWLHLLQLLSQHISALECCLLIGKCSCLLVSNKCFQNDFIEVLKCKLFVGCCLILSAYDCSKTNMFLWSLLSLFSQYFQLSLVSLHHIYISLEHFYI